MSQRLTGSEDRPLRVAVVGSGPSAFYAIEALFKVEGLHCSCDVFDRLPTPYGLVRGGVAPDHQNIKAVVRIYEKIAADPRFRFFGNVTVGRDLSVDELQALYDCVIWAIGNESDRALGIPGDDLDGVHSATAFVGWYNCHPDHQTHRFRLEDAQRVVVVGNGNVAMDVTRVLVSDPDELAKTDISQAAVEVLRRSSLREVVLLGRRGGAQAAFSTKEIEELSRVQGVDLVVPPDEVDEDPVTTAWLAGDAPRAAQRNWKFLREQAGHGEGRAPRKVRTIFRASPVEVLGRDGRVVGLRALRNELRADADGVPRPVATDESFTIDCEVVLAAIGYRGVPVPGLPFCERRGVVPNDEGRVLRDADGGEVLPGHYVVGWAKRGPTGLIGTNSPDSKATVAAIVEDLASATSSTLPDVDPQRIVDLLRQRDIDFVSYEDWLALDTWEQIEGRRLGKVRHKPASIRELLEVIAVLRRGPE